MKFGVHSSISSQQHLASSWTRQGHWSVIDSRFPAGRSVGYRSIPAKSYRFLMFSKSRFCARPIAVLRLGLWGRWRLSSSSSSVALGSHRAYSR